MDTGCCGLFNSFDLGVAAFCAMNQNKTNRPYILLHNTPPRNLGQAEAAAAWLQRC